MPAYDYFEPGNSDQYTFYRVPKELFESDDLQRISNDAKILYGMLLDRVDLSVRNGWVDKNNHVYIIYTQQEIMSRLKVSNKTASKLAGELESCGLIEKKRQGLGRPDIVYVKNFISRSETSTPRTCKNYISEREEVSPQAVEEVHTTNTNKTHTDKRDTHLNDTYLIRPQDQDSGDDEIVDSDYRFVVTPLPGPQSIKRTRFLMV